MTMAGRRYSSIKAPEAIGLPSVPMRSQRRNRRKRNAITGGTCIGRPDERQRGDAQRHTEPRCARHRVGSWGDDKLIGWRETVSVAAVNLPHGVQANHDPGELSSTSTARYDVARTQGGIAHGRA